MSDMSNDPINTTMRTIDALMREHGVGAFLAYTAGMIEFHAREGAIDRHAGLDLARAVGELTLSDACTAVDAA